MQKRYINFNQILEMGINHISDHLAWLLRSAMLSVCPQEAISVIAYNPNIPKDVWGVYEPACRGISINLEQHFCSALDAVQDKNSMNTNIKLIILRDLLDTALHEAWHGITCEQKGDYSDGNLDEEGAKEQGFNRSWAIAEHYDVGVSEFGPFLDALLLDFYNSLKEDVEADDCKEWKKIQFHMLENGIAYYDPDRGVEIRTFRDAMETYVAPEHAWTMENFSQYPGHSSVEEKLENITTQATAVAPSLPVQEPVAAPTAEVTPTPAAPTTTAPTMATCDGYNPLDDVGCVAPAATTMAAAPVAQTPVAPVQAVPQPSPATAAPQMDVRAIQQTAEHVLRRLFHHIYMKCEFNTAGGFNNPNAVLDPVSIADIPGATELFAQQDTVDANGVFQARQNVGGFIKGLVTAQGLPRYTFYLNIGGNMVKRTFIPQNPAKTNASGQPTKWATMVQQGWKICMLLEDNSGPTADIQLAPGVVLGQETFKIWDKK